MLNLKALAVALSGNLKYFRIPSFTKGMLPENKLHSTGTTLEPDAASIASALREHTGVTGSKTDVNLRVNELKELSMAYSV
jgi:hypothetical protein